MKSRHFAKCLDASFETWSLLHDAGKLCIIRGNETKEGRVARRSLHYKQGSNEMATKKVAKKAPAKKVAAKKVAKKPAAKKCCCKKAPAKKAPAKKAVAKKPVK